MRKFWLPILTLLASTTVLAQQSTTNLITEINTNLPNNTSGAITPAILRTTLIDIVNSFLNTVSLCSPNVSGAFPVYNVVSATWVCSTVGGSGSQISLVGTDATLIVPFPTFDVSSPSFLVGNSLNVTWTSASTAGVGYGLAVQSSVTTAVPGVSGAASGGLYGGVLLENNSVTDVAGVIGVLRNTAAVTNSIGSGVVGVMRGTLGQGTPATYGLRSVSETDGTDHPYVGLFVHNTTANNAFTNGAIIASAVTYGVRVGLTVAEGAGAPGNVLPAHPFSYFNGSGTEAFYVVSDGSVVAATTKFNISAAGAITSLATAGSNILATNNQTPLIVKTTAASTDVLLAMQSASASQQVLVQFNDVTTPKWYAGKSTANTFIIYDAASSTARITIDTSNITAGGVNFKTDTAAKTLVLKQGANGAVGTFICTSGGSIAVANTFAASTDAIIISLNTAGGTISTPPGVSIAPNGTQFTVQCATLDTGTYNYAIIKNAA